MASVSGPNGTPERTEQGPLTSCLVSGPRILPRLWLAQDLPIGAPPMPTYLSGFSSQTLREESSRLSCPGGPCPDHRVSPAAVRGWQRLFPRHPFRALEPAPCLPDTPRRLLGGSPLAQRHCLPGVPRVALSLLGGPSWQRRGVGPRGPGRVLLGPAFLRQFPTWGADTNLSRP